MSCWGLRDHSRAWPTTRAAALPCCRDPQVVQTPPASRSSDSRATSKLWFHLSMEEAAKGLAQGGPRGPETLQPKGPVSGWM